MKKHTLIFALAFFAITVSTTFANPISLGFNNGESSAYVDAYPRTTGSGWESAWDNFGGSKVISVETSLAMRTTMVSSMAQTRRSWRTIGSTEPT